MDPRLNAMLRSVVAIHACFMPIWMIVFTQICSIPAIYWPFPSPFAVAGYSNCRGRGLRFPPVGRCVNITTPWKAITSISKAS